VPKEGGGKAPIERGQKKGIGSNFYGATVTGTSIFGFFYGFANRSASKSATCVRQSSRGRKRDTQPDSDSSPCDSSKPDFTANGYLFPGHRSRWEPRP
jgi:hypothetical protein